MTQEPPLFPVLVRAPRQATWHFFDRATGLFTGASFTGTYAEAVAQMAHKENAVGLHCGEVDYLSQRKCLETGAVLDHRPDPPWDGTDLTLYQWAWDDGPKRWYRVPRDKKLRLDRWEQIKAGRDAAIDAVLETPHGDFDHHAPGRAAIARKAQELAQFGGEVDFTLADNTVARLGAAAMLEVWALSREREQSARDRATELRDALERAEGAEAINLINWSNQ